MYACGEELWLRTGIFPSEIKANCLAIWANEYGGSFHLAFEGRDQGDVCTPASTKNRLVPPAIVKTLNVRVSGMIDYRFTLSPGLPHELRGCALVQTSRTLARRERH